MTSHLAGTKIENLTDSEENTSGISLNTQKVLPALLKTVHRNKYVVQHACQMYLSTGYWVNRCRKDGILADNAEIVFSGLNPGKIL